MNRALLFGGAAVAVIAILFIIERLSGRTSVSEIGAAAGGLLIDAAAGGVIGIGEAVGVPRTNMSECERAIAEGRTWDASFACPAGTFIKSLF